RGRVRIPWVAARVILIPSTRCVDIGPRVIGLDAEDMVRALPVAAEREASQPSLGMNIRRLEIEPATGIEGVGRGSAPAVTADETEIVALEEKDRCLDHHRRHRLRRLGDVSRLDRSRYDNKPRRRTNGPQQPRTQTQP